MTPPKVLEEPQVKQETDPVELTSFRPEGCINTIRLLKRIEEEGEEVWLDDR